MNKTRNNTLIRYADEALNKQTANNDISRILADNNRDIESTYNGSIASLGVLSP